MNATRLYTLKYGQNRQILSIGRVQTPTLALIVKRQQEIENFTPQQYWVLATLYRKPHSLPSSAKAMRNWLRKKAMLKRTPRKPKRLKGTGNSSHHRSCYRTGTYGTYQNVPFTVTEVAKTRHRSTSRLF